ncbi:MAG TPA: universal stress protein, partial [Longimicrobiales bacterium]
MISWEADMFKNIMLPVDGSHFSELALPLAVQIARKSNARLHIVRVHVAGVQTAEAVISDNYEELVRDWERDALSAARSRAAALGVETTAELLEGPVVD